MTKITYKGHEFDFDAAVNLMDAELVEALSGSTETDQEFMIAYAKAHEAKYGAEFVIN